MVVIEYHLFDINGQWWCMTPFEEHVNYMLELHERLHPDTIFEVRPLPVVVASR